MIVRSGYLRISSVGTIPRRTDDQPLAGARHFRREAADALDLAVAVFVRAVDVDQGHIQHQRRQQSDFYAGKRIFDHFGGAVAERVSAEHGTRRQEGHAHRRRFHPPGDGPVRPLDALLDLPRFHRPPQRGRGPVDFETDVGDVELLHQTGGQPQVQFEHALPADAQILFILSDDLARQRHRGAHRPVQFGADIAAIVDEAADGLLLAHTFCRPTCGIFGSGSTRGTRPGRTAGSIPPCQIAECP
jgi:hypothetical protein